MGRTNLVIILALVVITCVLAEEASKRKTVGIIGGDTAKRNAYPYQGVILFQKGIFCGLSVIDANFAITAAHCFDKGFKNMKVLFGAHSWKKYNGTGQVRSIEVFARHPNYNSKSSEDDIALIYFKQKLKFTDYVKPIKLSDNQDYPTGKAIATGWGLTQDGEYDSIPDFLQTVDLDFMPYQECYDIWGFLPDNACCAKGQGKDTCQGDSGGPLVQVINNDFVLVGVTSFGADCGSKVYPGVYTWVSKYLDWIAKTKKDILDQQKQLA